MTSIALGPTVSHTEVLERILYVHALNMIVYYLQRIGRPTIKMLHCCSFYDKYSTCKSKLIVFLATMLIFTNATFPLRLKNILLKYPKKECHGRGGADLLTRSRADHCCGNHCCRYLIPLLELSYCRRRRHRMSQSSMLLAARRDRYDSRLRDRAVT